MAKGKPDKAAEDAEASDEPRGDRLSDDSGVEQYNITEEGQALLARQDRNHLMRQKTHEQLQAEDVESKEIWGYDDEGNKVMLVGEDGERLVPTEVTDQVALA